MLSIRAEGRFLWRSTQSSVLEGSALLPSRRAHVSATLSNQESTWLRKSYWNNCIPPDARKPLTCHSWKPVPPVPPSAQRGQGSGLGFICPEKQTSKYMGPSIHTRKHPNIVFSAFSRKVLAEVLCIYLAKQSCSCDTGGRPNMWS